MGDEQKKPDPIDDVRKGLGLLFRAAKTAVSELPKGKVEDVVATGLREVGRAVESVAHTIEREVFKSGATKPEAHATPADPATPADAATPAKPSEPEPDKAGDAGKNDDAR